MRRLVSKVIRRHEPVCSDLSLNAEIPVSHRGVVALVIHGRNDVEKLEWNVGTYTRSGIDRIRQTCGSVEKVRRLRAVSHAIDVEMDAAIVAVDHREKRLPSETITNGEFLAEFPGIGAIHSDIFGSLVARRSCSARPLRD